MLEGTLILILRRDAEDWSLLHAEHPDGNPVRSVSGIERFHDLGDLIIPCKGKHLMAAGDPQ